MRDAERKRQYMHDYSSGQGSRGAAAVRRYEAKIRQQVFDHYGNRCICCGEDNPVFLTIDHINNDGAKHRKKLSSGGRSRSGISIYKDLHREGFPDDVRLLCYNCNLGRQRNGGVCPHEGALAEVISIAG